MRQLSFTNRLNGLKASRLSLNFLNIETETNCLLIHVLCRLVLYVLKWRELVAKGQLFYSAWPINILKISLVGSKSENGWSKFIVSVSANRLVGCSLQICCSGVIFVWEFVLMLPNWLKGATRLSVGRSEFDLLENTLAICCFHTFFFTVCTLCSPTSETIRLDGGGQIYIYLYWEVLRDVYPFQCNISGFHRIDSCFIICLS